MIIFGKVVGSIFNSGDYHVLKFRAAGGAHHVATYRGENPPPVRRSVQIEVRGHWDEHKRFGKQLCIGDWVKSEVKEVDYNHRNARRFS